MPAIDDNDGCDVAESCLQCPLSVCRYEDVTVYYAWRRQQRGQTCGWCGKPSNFAYCNPVHERLAANARRRERKAVR